MKILIFFENFENFENFEIFFENFENFENFVIFLKILKKLNFFENFENFENFDNFETNTSTVREMKNNSSISSQLVGRKCRVYFHLPPATEEEMVSLFSFSPTSRRGNEDLDFIPSQ